MNIVEATRKAMKVDGFIARKISENHLAIESRKTLIKPNGDFYRYILTENYDAIRDPRRMYSPTADDLMAEDWKVFSLTDVK